MRRLAGLAALALVALVVLPASAATQTVTVQNFSFTPASPGPLAQGTTVDWRFEQPGLTVHTTTSNQGFWDSGTKAGGTDFAVTQVFENAGTYAYHCTVHASMTGRIRILLKATGSAADGWKVRWSSLASTPSDRTFDVQLKRPGAKTWSAFRTDTAKRSASFHPAKAGTYAFRARTDNLTSGKSSGWSPVKKVALK